LDEKLSTIPGIKPQGKNVKATLNTHYMYMFYYDKNSFNGLSRNEFVEYLNHEGIPAFIAYPVVSDVDFFKSREFRGQLELSESWKENELPISHKVANEVVWLPHFSLLGSEEDIDDIYGAILKIKQCMDD
jgi:3-amino-5-hydroxybenzoate synthase